MNLALFDSEYQKAAGIIPQNGHSATKLTTALFATDQTFLFLNDQLPRDRKNQIIKELEQVVQQKNLDVKNCLLIPTSGTTSANLKIAVLKRERFLNAARRVNQFLKSIPDDSWLLSLPLHHVAGLSIVARAFLMKNSIFFFAKWNPEAFVTAIESNRISFCSLVPTQIFDLTTQEIKAPPSLKCVLVGGSALSDSQEKKMRNLGWPLLKTFGMTETSAFISTSLDSKYYEPLPGVAVQINSSSHLSINCNSLFDGYLLQDKQSWHFQPRTDEKNFWTTDDRASIAKDANGTRFEILGRDKSMIKIKGELVNLSLLNLRLNDLVTQAGLPHQSVILHSLPNQRNENEIIALFSETENEGTQSQVVQQFNDLVLPFEHVHWYIKVPEISKSDLGKIKINFFSSDAFKEFYFEKRKRILDRL